MKILFVLHSWDISLETFADPNWEPISGGSQVYLEILPQLVHHPSVLAADLLAPGAAVGGVVANMDAGSRESRALGARADGAVGGALALGAVVRV